MKFACKVRMCEISHIRTSHTCDVRSGAAEKWLPILRFWDYERKFACKVRMCEISHIRTSHTCDVRSGAAEKWLPILRFWDYERKFACKVRMCEISHIRTSHTCDVRSGATGNGCGYLGCSQRGVIGHEICIFMVAS